MQEIPTWNWLLKRTQFVSNNASFLADLDHLQQPEDLLSDDLGSWDQSKTATEKYL